MAGPKSANFLNTSGTKRPRKIIVRVLEKYVRLVALTYTSQKVNVTASKLVPRKERLGPRGLKRFPIFKLRARHFDKRRTTVSKRKCRFTKALSELTNYYDKDI